MIDMSLKTFLERLSFILSEQQNQEMENMFLESVSVQDFLDRVKKDVQ
ncbi:MAG: hypothetical protein KKD48_03520 [Nanoarchaeota archaeon]|nr:hypothetical protein [Nanoarchaeota archaeon]